MQTQIQAFILAFGAYTGFTEATPTEGADQLVPLWQNVSSHRVSPKQAFIHGESHVYPEDPTRVLHPHPRRTRPTVEVTTVVPTEVSKENTPDALTAEEDKFEFIIETEFGMDVGYWDKRFILTKYKGQDYEIPSSFTCPEGALLNHKVKGDIWVTEGLNGTDVVLDIHVGNWCYAATSRHASHHCKDCWDNLWIKYNGRQYDVPRECHRWDHRTDSVPDLTRGGSTKANITCSWN